MNSITVLLLPPSSCCEVRGLEEEGFLVRAEFLGDLVERIELILQI